MRERLEMRRFKRAASIAMVSIFPVSHTVFGVSFSAFIRLVGSVFGYFPLNLLRVQGIIFLVLLTGMLVVPRSIEAGCGDYVLVTRPLPGQSTSLGHQSESAIRLRSERPVSAVRLQMQAIRQLFANRVHDSNTLPHKPASPCRGPSCSKETIPPFVPALQISIPQDGWISSAFELIVGQARSAACFTGIEGLIARDCGSSLYRPPDRVARRVPA
jgi:hypothetical protein